MHMSRCIHEQVCENTHEIQKRVLDPLELVLKAAVSLLMWVLGTKVRPSANALSY